MFRRSETVLSPRNGHVLEVGITARISGCKSQKEVSLDDQVDHGKEETSQLYKGLINYHITKTKGKGERLDQPELAIIEKLFRSNSRWSKKAVFSAMPTPI